MLAVIITFIVTPLSLSFPNFKMGRDREYKISYFIPQELGAGRQPCLTARPLSHQETGAPGTSLEPGQQPRRESIQPGNPQFILKATMSKPFSKALLSGMECFLGV